MREVLYIFLLGMMFLMAVLRGGGREAKPEASQADWRPVRIRVSHYWPPLGGANCFRWDGKSHQCLSAMASGEDWRRYVDPSASAGAAACPPEWPFGTRIRAFGKEWICLDRGEAIRLGPDGIPWVDFLAREIGAPHGAVIEALIHFDGDN